MSKTSNFYTSVFGIFRKKRQYFPKLSLNSKISFICKSLKKELGFWSYSKKVRGFKNFAKLFVQKTEKVRSSKKFLGFLGKTEQFDLKLFLNSKNSCTSTLFIKEVSFLRHIMKKLQTHKFLQTCSSQKALGSE